MTISDALEVRLSENLYLLDKGVRDCALIEMDYKDTPWYDELVNIVKNEVNKFPNISLYIEEIEVPEENEIFCNVWLYKYDHQRILIESMGILRENGRFLYYFCMGSLLGYSGASMEEFISRTRREGNDEE